MPVYEYKLGLTQGTMTNLESMSTPVRAPKSHYRPSADVRKLASGKVRGIGWPVATWSFETISKAERDMLKNFCPGTSAEIYVRTRTNESLDSYQDFIAVMVWPTQAEEKDAGYRLGFEIEFTTMREVT